jgi:hypothetical protein
MPKICNASVPDMHYDLGTTILGMGDLTYLVSPLLPSRGEWSHPSLLIPSLTVRQGCEPCPNLKIEINF